MKAVLKKSARKQLDRTNEPLKTQLLSAIKGLEREPSDGDIKRLDGGPAEYRLRVGGYRLFYDIKDNEIIISKIVTRGHAYKHRRKK